MSPDFRAEFRRRSEERVAEARAREAYGYHKTEAHAAAVALRDLGDRPLHGLIELSPLTLRIAEKIASGLSIERVALDEYLAAWGRTLSAGGPAPHTLGL